MIRYAHNLVLLSKRILLLVFFYFLCRILFFAFNADYFSSLSPGNIFIAFVHGIRFDLSAIIILNTPFIALHFFPAPFFYSKPYQKILTWLFEIVNITALLFNFIDLKYFRFTFRRTTADVFNMLSLGNDFTKLLPSMIADFWYLLLLWILLSFFLMKWFSKLTRRHITAYNYQRGNILKKFAVHFIVLVFIVIGFRGGIQYKPINIISAGEFNSVQATPLVLNTPFSIIKSWDEHELSELNYFAPQKAAEIFSPLHRYSEEENFRPLNIVIIILESFSKEYIGAYNPQAHYTPFLDSLISQSLSFSSSYANGKRSIEAIPSILAGLPALSSEPFITSVYSGNRFNSLPGILKEKNYSTSFFHGGNNGTMGFDRFASIAGFEKYYGKDEFGNEKDYDGAWGIYDEEFLQFTAQKLNTSQQPFFATVFTLSSHHPYSIPEKYKGRFSKGTLPIHESIQYTDYSLMKFFKTVSAMPWFDNTLFVITADHTALSQIPFYHTNVGMYSVPLLFYHKNQLIKSVSTLTVQHSAILPSILDYVNYDKPFVAFGESVFDSTAAHFAVCLQNDVYQVIENDFILQADTSKVIGLYNFKTDSLLSNNLADKNIPVENELAKKLRAFTQQYNHAMIHNKLMGE
jgi:phosphoglycerol transferase MdoB-like AlkP superfamily enzyme